MSNLRSTAHLPLKTSMTNKWKAQAPNSELLERQTRALEESLNKLKIAMHPEKSKTSSDSNAPIWDKGKTGPLTQYANHVLREDPTKTFDANKPTKIRVLGDEPPATVARPSLVANLFTNKSSNNSNIKIRCGQCEKEEAKMKCLECAESYCAACFAHFHLRGALQRHRCVPLADSRPSTPQKKKSTVGADVIFKELRFAQSKEDLFRKSMMNAGGQVEDVEEEEDDYYDDDEPLGGDLLRGKYDEKTSAASFQQALLQWRQGGTTNNGKKSETPRTMMKKSTHETGIDTVYDSNGRVNSISMPKIEFHSSSKLSYGEKLLLKKYRRANKTTDGQMKLDIEPMYEDLPTDRTFNSEDKTPSAATTDRTIRNEDEERTKSRASRPNSSAKRLNSARSRPPSAALFQQPLPSLLATNPSNDLKTISDNQPNSSRPSSAALKRPTKIESRLPTMWNRNWKPEQSVSDGVDATTIQIDQTSIRKFDSVLEDLLDEDKIELASRSENPPTPIVSPIKPIRKESPVPAGRRSLFTFADSPRKTESSSSADTGEGGFFTDMHSRTSVAAPVKAPLPPPPPPPMMMVDVEEHSRPGSSLSSASLPVSIISSQPDLITHPSITRNPKASVAPKKFRVEYAKKPSAPPMVIEGKKVTSARDSEEHPRTKISSGLAPRSSYQSQQHLMKTSSTSSITTVTRDENILKDESLTLSNSARQPKKSKARKIEFSVRDGPKWQQGSTSLSASVARPSTPSNPNNTKIANQFSSYDQDDGRSSRACQDVDDEECFNQLQEELTSELGTASPGWNASLSEHVLKNLRTADVTITEKDLQENLSMLEKKLRESEILQQSQANDDDMSIHDEIRKL